MSTASLAAAAALTAALSGTVTWPGPLEGPGTARVIDIRDVTRDGAGAASVTTGAGTLEARLNANVAFAKDSAELTPAGRARLAEIAASASTLPAGRLSVTGSTDDLGSSAHGLELSQRRAQAVAAALKPSLPAAVTVAVTGKGEADPLVPNVDEASRAKNRRVQVAFSPAL